MFSVTHLTPLLISLPLFIFAGTMLSESGAPERILKISRLLLGWLPGGLAVIALLVCAVFTAFTGASGVTIFALGGLLLPAIIWTYAVADGGDFVPGGILAGHIEGPAIGLLLGLFGVLGAGLVGLSHQGTAERIARNEREALLEQLDGGLDADRVGDLEVDVGRGCVVRHDVADHGGVEGVVPQAAIEMLGYQDGRSHAHSDQPPDTPP